MSSDPRNAAPVRWRGRSCRTRCTSVSAGAAETSGVDVLQQDADEYDQAYVLVVDEGAQASARLASADQPLLPQKQQCGGGHAGVVPAPELHAAPYQHQGV